MAMPAPENGGGGVTLYVSKFSLYAWRPQLALIEKGIPFTPVHVDFSNKPKELLEANPIYGKIPTMVHDGNSICESAIILEYVEETWPDKTPLMPKDALAKSKIRFWTDYIYKGFASAFQSGRAKSGSSEKEAAKAEVLKFYKTLEATMAEYSADGPFFTGDQFGYLDIVLSPLACWFRMLDLLMECPVPGPDELPRLNKWRESMRARKSIQDTFPTDDEVYEYFVVRKKRYYDKLQAEASAAK